MREKIQISQKNPWKLLKRDSLPIRGAHLLVLEIYESDGGVYCDNKV